MLNYPEPLEGSPAQRLTVSSSAVALTALPKAASKAWVDLQGGDVFFTTDGTVPSASNGHRLYPGPGAFWSARTVTLARFIRVGATDGIVTASPYIG